MSNKEIEKEILSIKDGLEAKVESKPSIKLDYVDSLIFENFNLKRQVAILTSQTSELQERLSKFAVNESMMGMHKHFYAKYNIDSNSEKIEIDSEAGILRILKKDSQGGDEPGAI